MIRIPTVAALAGLSLGFLLPAQEPEKAPPAASKTEAQDGRSVADLIHQLGDDSFKLRLDAERKLRAMGKDVLPELRKAAEQKDDAEVQWRARRLVRQIERGDTGALGRRDDTRQLPSQEPHDPFAGEDMRQRFDELFRSLEHDFDIDIPRSRFFANDFFKDLQEQMQEFRQHMQALPQGGTSSGQSMSMQVGPNGVRVEIKRKNAKGEEESKVYEAPDMDTFRQKYPGVLEQHGLGLRFFGGPLGGGSRLRLGLPQAQWPEESDDTPEPAAVITPPPGKRLGVVVRPEIPADLRGYLGLGDDEGLMVEEVQPDTLAKTLGIERDDIVVKIGSQSIHGTADVQKVLGDIAPGGKVEVTVLRKGKQVVLQGTKPDEKAAEKARSSPLEKRGK